MCYIIDYIVKYQNTYISSFLFHRNIEQLLNSGINVSELFSSQVFCYTFDYDEWPSTHTDKNNYTRPYNGSIFELRHNYRKIFHEDKFDVPDEDMPVLDSSKVYKVSYSINMLTLLGEYIEQTEDKSLKFVNKDVSLIDLCIQNELIDVFESANFIELIVFKWNGFA